MAKGFKPVDRGQVFLSPPDMRDWLPEEHLVWFLLDVVDSFDLAAFLQEYRLGGPGREAFDPRMMVALLAYAYCGGVRSSRAIERDRPSRQGPHCVASGRFGRRGWRASHR